MLSACFRAARARRGSIAIIVAVTAIPLTIALGMTVDYARLLTVRTELQRSADSAAIAGARSMISSPTNLPTVTSDARMYFWANYRHNLLGSTIVGVQPTVSADFTLGTVRVDATARVPLLFGGFLGISTADLVVQATAEKFVPGLELVVAVDNSNSMKAAGRLAALKTGANKLMDIVYGNVDQVYNDVCPLTPGTPQCREYKILVGLVPFVASVNVRGNTLRNNSGASGLSINPQQTDNGGFGANLWKGCVEAIPGSGDMPGYDGFGAVDPALSAEYAANTGNFPPSWDTDGASGPALPVAVSLNPYRWKPNPWSQYFRTTATPTIGTYLTPNYWVPVGPPASQERWWLTVYSGMIDVLWHYWRGTGSGHTFTAGAVDNGVNGPAGPRESGPNRGCGYPVLPLQTSKTLAQSAINELQFGAPNGTTIGLGFTWAWRLLSHNWQPVWQHGDGFSPYGGLWNTPIQAGPNMNKTQALTPVARPANPALLPNVKKIVVLFTDAAGNEMGVCPSAPVLVSPGPPPQWESASGDCWYYSAYGDWQNNPLGSTPETQLDQQMVRVCAAMKASGIQIYTIVVDPSLSPSIEALMRGPVGCSSDTTSTGPASYFFLAPDNTSLTNAFLAVGASIANLRLVN